VYNDSKVKYGIQIHLTKNDLLLGIKHQLINIIYIRMASFVCVTQVTDLLY
jgi:hypothetical protein